MVGVVIFLRWGHGKKFGLAVVSLSLTTFLLPNDQHTVTFVQSLEFVNLMFCFEYLAVTPVNF